MAARLRALLNYDKHTSSLAEASEAAREAARVAAGAPPGLQRQDACSLRCVPQVHGVVHDSLAFVRVSASVCSLPCGRPLMCVCVQGVVSAELNSATDNPLVLEDGAVLCGGNLHGAYPTQAADMLAVATHQLATISEVPCALPMCLVQRLRGCVQRRLERLLNPALSEGLPAFLVRAGGPNSGLLVAHTTAAALTSENKVLVHPASADSLPTAAGRDDHISMGGHAARKALTGEHAHPLCMLPSWY